MFQFFNLYLTGFLFILTVQEVFCNYDALSNRVQKNEVQLQECLAHVEDLKASLNETNAKVLQISESQESNRNDINNLSSTVNDIKVEKSQTQIFIFLREQKKFLDEKGE